MVDLQEVADDYAKEMKARVDKSKCEVADKHHFMFMPHIDDFACIKCGKTMYAICYPRKKEGE